MTAVTESTGAPTPPAELLPEVAQSTTHSCDCQEPESTTVSNPITKNIGKTYTAAPGAKSVSDRFLSIFSQPHTKLPPPPLEVSVNDAGKYQIATKDGYTLTFEGDRQEWTIAHPDGKKTTIWGDPHVVESDGDKWDFKNLSTFYFGKNKVTVETVPLDGPEGPTYSSKVHVYNGVHHVAVSGIDSNQPHISSGLSLHGEAHDWEQDDGDVYFLKTVTGSDAFGWERYVDPVGSEVVEDENS